MSLNYAEDVQPLEGDGVTDSDIATLLNADPRTNTDVKIILLKRYLRDQRLLNTSRNNGSLLDNYDQIPAQLQQVVDKLSDVVTDQVEDIKTTVDPDAGEFSAGLEGLLAASQITQAQHDYVVNTIAGGKKFSGVTAADVAACRTAYNDQVSQDAKIAALNDAHDAATQAFAVDNNLTTSQVVSVYQTALVAKWGD